MFNQYTKIVTNESDEILSFVINIKNSFNQILEINKYEETIEKRKEYCETIFKKEFNEIEINLSKIVEKLHYIRNFCYDDLKKMGTLLNLEKEEDIDIIKNTNKIIPFILQLNFNDEKKEDIIKSSKMNENIRFFIHQVMNILSITKPIFVNRILEKEISKNEILKDNKFITSKINTNIYQIEKFEKELNALNIINNENYTFDINNIQIDELINYISIYSDKIVEYPYSGELFNINLELINNSTIDSFKSNKDKLEEIIDVIINNGCEELCNKDLESNNTFNKLIIVNISNDNKFLLIEIKDNGRGIKNIDKIFEPYFTTKAANGGSGIGLTAAIRVLESLKGELKVKTNNDGSTFIIILPIN